MWYNTIVLQEYFKGRNFRVQKKLYGINFRVSRFLKEISRKELSRIEEKVYFSSEKLRFAVLKFAKA